MQKKKLFVYVFVFLSTVILGLWFSWGSIPNQEGYYEISWNLTYLNFDKYILQPQVTPLNFLLPLILVKILPLSLANAWKVLDLLFGGIAAVFIVRQAIISNQFRRMSDMLKTPLLMISSIGAVLPLTSMTGEGLSVLICLLGLHAWLNQMFVAGALLFSLAMLSKYTVFLILPGITLWTILNWSHYTYRQKQKVILASVILLGVFVTYESIKHWSDFLAQAGSSSNLRGFIVNPPYFFLGILVGAPIIVTISLLWPNFKHLFWISCAGAFFCFMPRYYMWHYPYQFIPFLFYYVVTQPKFMRLVSYRLIGAQLIVFICISLVLPLKLGSITLYPKHISYQEMNQISDIITSNYHGGKIGYYLNRPFNEPFPAYEISYMGSSWRFQMEQTEYVVLPDDFVPPVLLGFPGCNLQLVKTVKQNSIYKVNCIGVSTSSTTSI